MSDAGPWQMRITGGLSAHFKQPDGPSRPGTDWSVELKRGDEVRATTVRTLYAEDLWRKLQNDTTYLSRTAMQYLGDLLNQGWHPDEERQHVIVVGNPPGAAKKPFWKFW